MSKSLVFSQFNHVVKNPENGKYVIKNFLTGSLIQLDTLQYYLYKAAPSLSSDDPAVIALKRGGFLTEPGELERLKRHVVQEAASPTLLKLVIAPTMACNFACPYCFENNRPGKMSKRVQEDLVRFAERQMDSAPTKDLLVSWYGGEPLLQLDTIEHLSEQLAKAAQDRGVTSRFWMLTNGYLLDGQTARRLKNVGVEGYQITLDGADGTTNDPLRVSKDGKSSFERITRNLLDLPEGVYVRLRHMINQDNKDGLSDMIALAHNLNEQSKATIELFPTLVDYQVSAHSDGIGKAICQAEGPDLLESRGYFGGDPTGKFLPGSYRGTYCESQTTRMFVIDEQGLLYQCIEECGKQGYSFGSVADGPYALTPEGNCAEDFCRFSGEPFPESAECQECCLLPACMGGCPRRYYMTGARQCNYAKRDLDAYVLSLIQK